MAEKTSDDPEEWMKDTCQCAIASLLVDSSRMSIQFLIDGLCCGTHCTFDPYQNQMPGQRTLR
jgi:hypothetical protein